MNLRNIAKYMVFVWLPLAASEVIDENSTEQGPDKVSGAKTIREGSKSDSAITNLVFDAGPNENIAQATVNEDLGSTANRSALQEFSGSRESASAEIPDGQRRQSNRPRSWPGKRRKRKKKTGRPKRQSTEEEYEEEDEEDDANLEDLDNEELEEGNSTELGRYLGSPCEVTCSAKLLHVFCDPNNRICECEKKYPVQIGVGRGCAKPKQLGDQCFYAQTCSFSDPNAICMQINHNAICQCKPGFHSVALRRGAKRSFCSEDQVVVSADLPTLLGVTTGIAVLTGLICFVLKLFNSNRYPDQRHYNGSGSAPPLLLSSDNQWINGIPLTVHGRPSSRSSSQRSTTNLSQYSRGKGVLVPASRAGAARAAAILLIPCHLQPSKAPDTEVAIRSRNDDSEAQETDKEHFSRPGLQRRGNFAGSRRPSISSIRSTTSSQKSMSYSARRFEQENQQKEQRAAMRAAREEAARLAAPPTPSPLSTDELLPACNKAEVEDPLGFASAMRTPSPRNGSMSDLDSKHSPCIPIMSRL